MRVPMKKKLLIGLLVLGFMPFLVGGIVAAYKLTTTDLVASEADQMSIVDASDLVEYYTDWEPDSQFERWEKKKYIDGSLQVSYHYESTLDSEPFIASSIEKEADVREAESLFQMSWAAIAVGSKFGAANLEEDHSFYRVGDASKFAHIKNSSNERSGHMLVVRKDVYVYTFMIAGFSIDNKEYWAELFDERIKNLSVTD